MPIPKHGIHLPESNHGNQFFMNSQKHILSSKNFE